MSSADLTSSSTTSAVRVRRHARSRGAGPAGADAAAGASSGAASGSQTVKQDPSPTALCTATAPPCNSASSLTMASPSPVPSNFRARPLSIWLKGLNSCSSPSGGMPMPLSVTLISRKSVNSLSANGKVRPVHGAGELADVRARDAGGTQRHVAALDRELHRVRKQVVDDLLHLARVR